MVKRFFDTPARHSDNSEVVGTPNTLFLNTVSFERLSVFKRLLNDSFTLVFWNLETVFKACGAWFVLQFVLLIATQMTLGGAADITAHPEAALTSHYLLLIVISAIFGAVSSASISVAWHRFGLLGDVPDLIHLKVGAIEIRFILKSILLFLIILAVFIPLSTIFGIVAGLMHMPMVLNGLLVLTGIFLAPHFIRLYLMLPATAIERPIGIKQAHALGKGLGWQMIGAMVALSLPFILISVGLQYLLPLIAGSLPLLLIQFKVLILNLLLQIIITVLGVSVITAAYRIAMERVDNQIPE